jgi:hypothetical protein
VRPITALVPTLVLCAALPAAAQTTLVPQITGNTVTANISLAGDTEADLTITFEQAVGLNANALSLTVGLVNPTDTSLLSRFPDPTSVSIPAAFPVLLRIDPTAASGLSFSGVYRLTLHTHNLTLTTNSPLRLYKASNGGPFQDMTAAVDAGSVRPGGDGGGYSEFLVVVDTRLTDGVISGKFTKLNNDLAANGSAINPAVLADLQQRLATAKDLYTQGQIASAINAAQAFADQVKQQSGANIPDVWRANGNLVNVAGLLRSDASTLKFSLTWKANGAP